MTEQNVSIYCVRCRKKVEVEAELGELSNGRAVWKGICPTCEKPVFRFAKKQV